MTTFSQPDEFRVVVSAVDHVAIVEVTGDVDLATVSAFSQAVDQAAADAPSLLVDLCGCSMIDSSGLRVLVDLKRASEVRGTRVALACPPESSPARMIELVFPAFFEVHPDRNQAIRELQG